MEIFQVLMVANRGSPFSRGDPSDWEKPRFIHTAGVLIAIFL